MIASKNEWGNSAWTFMHVIACKVKIEEFSKQKENIMTIIRGICSNLPCPDCRSHAEKQMRRLNSVNITTKEEMKEMLREFHNSVNIRTNKRIFSKGEMVKYEKASTSEAVSVFFKTWFAGSSTPRLMMDTFARVRFLEWIISYFDKNNQFYDP